MFKKNKNIPTIEKNKIQLNLLYKCRDFEISTQNINDDIPSYDNSICLLKAGRYSPSKINIIIGLISLCAWFIIYLSHLTFLCIFISDNKCILFAFFILLLFVLETIILNSCKSS